MSQTLAGSAVKKTCGRCSRTVHMIPVAGLLVACDPEVIAVVPSGRLGETIAATATLTGRRVHAELCEGYQLAEQRERTRREMVEFTRRQGKRKGNSL